MAENIEINLREEAKRLFLEKRVDVIIGYETGTLPLTATPCFIDSREEADRLVFNELCTQNLAKYVHDFITNHRNSQKRLKPEDRKKKIIGVVARGCTTRSLVLHLQERQYGRDEVYIIGVPCAGYIDRRKMEGNLHQEEILEGNIVNGQINITTASGSKTLSLAAMLADNCLVCRFNNPVISDIMIGQPAPPINSDNEYASIKEFEEKSLQERWDYFTKEMGKCIRCYACRQACPSCYCPTCFTDQSQPQWLGIGDDQSDTQVYQCMRLFHMVGRCVDCGSCVSVCPTGVDLRHYLKKEEKDCLELFGSRAGSSLEEMPPLGKFSENDNQDFIYNP